MTLQDALEERGRWLFRHRSHLPLLIAPVCFAAMLTMPPAPAAARWSIAALVVAVAGLTLRAVTAGYVPGRTSGRNTASQVADVLNTTGLYSVVRHPLYLGNAIIVSGVMLTLGCWWLVAIVLLAFGLYYERIMLAEEAFLREKFGRTFEVWAARVPAIFPKLSLWQNPVLPFSWRTVIRREYHGAVGILAAVAGLHWLGLLVADRQVFLDPLTTSYAVIAAVLFSVCRFLSKRTHLLRVQGR